MLFFTRPDVVINESTKQLILLDMTPPAVEQAMKEMQCGCAIMIPSEESVAIFSFLASRNNIPVRVMNEMGFEVLRYTPAAYPPDISVSEISEPSGAVGKAVDAIFSELGVDLSLNYGKNDATV